MCSAEEAHKSQVHGQCHLTVACCLYESGTTVSLVLSSTPVVGGLILCLFCLLILACSLQISPTGSLSLSLLLLAPPFDPKSTSRGWGKSCHHQKLSSVTPTVNEILQGSKQRRKQKVSGVCMLPGKVLSKAAYWGQPPTGGKCITLSVHD